MRTLKVHVEFLEELLGTASSDPKIHERFIASKAPDAPKLEQEVESLGAEAVEERGMTIFSRMPDGETPMLWDYQIKGYMKDACSMLRRVPTMKSKNLKAFKKEIDGLIFPGPRMIALHAPDAVYSTTRGGVSVTVKPADADYVNVTLTAGESVTGGVQYDHDYIAFIEAPLLADGQETGKTVELNEDNGWTATVRMPRCGIHSCQRPLRASTAQGERVALAHSEALPAGTWFDMEVGCLVDSDVDYVLEWLQYGVLRGIGQWRNSGKGRFACRVVDADSGKVLLDNIKKVKRAVA